MKNEDKNKKQNETKTYPIPVEEPKDLKKKNKERMVREV
jgi:hypothetical protein